jgi:ATP-binding cassette subfamily B protein
LLQRVRQHWPRATLLFVSHDLEDTLAFDRVLVLDAGRIVEDGAPKTLYEDAASRYAQLTRGDQALRGGLWSAAQWRRQTIEKQRVQELDRS